MSINQKQIAEVLSQFEDEGNAKLYLAPLKSLPVDVPAVWKEVLQEPEVKHGTVKTLWAPLIRDLPRTLDLLGHTLISVGLLSTNREPFSLLYFFQQAGDIYAMRGFCPREITRPEKSKLPPELLNFYKLHDGWIDIYSKSNGPLPSADWFFLSQILDDEQMSELKEDFDPDNFLAIFHNGAATFVGFDISQSPPLCFICWKDDPPEIVPDFWQCIDDWIVQYLEFFDPR